MKAVERQRQIDSVLATNGSGPTHGKGRVLATKAVVTQDKGSVAPWACGSAIPTLGTIGFAQSALCSSGSAAESSSGSAAAGEARISV